MDQTPQEHARAIYGFSEAFLKKNFDAPKATPEFHKTVWEYCCSDHPRVAISAPRGHAKSTSVTHTYVLYRALFRLNDNIMIVSDTETQAIAFLGDIKMELNENDNLRKAFGIKGLSKDSEKEIRVKFDDGHQFRIIAKGALTSLRGAKWRNKRPNLIVGDDMENDESVMNEDRREKLKKWVFSALLETLSSYGIARFVGTILHFDSFLEGVMPDTTLQTTRVEGLRTYSEEDNPLWHSIKFRAHTDFDDFTERLWPEQLPIAVLKAKRQNYINQGFPEGYSQEYLNYPIAEASAFFRHEDMVPMTAADYEKRDAKLLRYYAAIDPAISTKDRRSYTAIVVAGEDSEGMLNVVDVIRERMDSMEIIDAMFAVQSRYNPDLFIVEQGAIEKSLGPFLKDEMMKPTRPFINLLTKPPTVDKRSRARAIQGRMRQGGVRFDTEASWYPAYYEEMIRFDRGQNDDQVDATAWLGLVLNEMVPGQTKEEKEDEEWDEEFDDYEFESGRSSITGY